MLFNSLEYFVFLTGIAVACFLAAPRWRVGLLLAASYFFYMCWRWEYAVFLLVQTLISYACARYLGWERRRLHRQVCLSAAISASLAMLAYFKYYNFFVDSVAGALGALGLGLPLTHLEIILPVGISFYSFRAVSYVVDVYRGTIPAGTRFWHFALYLAFFPLLLAGPIERAGPLLAQFDRKHSFDIARFVEGGKLIAWGLFKKVVIADRLAFYVDRIYGDPGSYSGSTLLLATYFFAFQIYCDFSGYSDMAIGSARILGYDLMQNFNLPYYATSLTDFWRRWHISLSTWFRDYVYIPLGGSRVSVARWSLNIAAVFLLSGLWHGARWTFVVWGGLHAFYYLAEQVGRRWTRNLSFLKAIPPQVAKPLQIVVVFHLVLFAWVFFRATSISEATMIVSRMATDLGGRMYLGPSQFTMGVSILLIGVLLLYQYAQARGFASLYFSRTRVPLPVRFAGYAGLILMTGLLAVPTHRFIYSQF
jgi:alginate O-acetyltransferase complex protein AlgI